MSDQIFDCDKGQWVSRDPSTQDTGQAPPPKKERNCPPNVTSDGRVKEEPELQKFKERVAASCRCDQHVPGKWDLHGMQIDVNEQDSSLILAMENFFQQSVNDNRTLWVGGIMVMPEVVADFKKAVEQLYPLPDEEPEEGQSSKRKRGRKRRSKHGLDPEMVKTVLRRQYQNGVEATEALTCCGSN